MKLSATALFLALGTMGISVSAIAKVDVWLNETDVGGEMDYAVLQWPSTLSLNAGESANIYGRVYEAGMTEAAGANPAMIAQWGYGPQSSDPRTVLWTWLGASYNMQIGSDDEYYFLATAPAGIYSYTYRYSQDGGLSWTLADLNGAGANAGLTFEPAQTGLLTVVPEPVSLTPVAIALLALAKRRRG